MITWNSDIYFLSKLREILQVQKEVVHQIVIYNQDGTIPTVTSQDILKVLLDATISEKIDF